MVPDLAALKFQTDADYWRRNIIEGKPGSLMPAFARWEGGILDTNQIESLVQYLVETYPSKLAASATNASQAGVSVPQRSAGSWPMPVHTSND
jgi:hypothetical protein